ETPAAAAEGAAFVFACTGNDDALREICTGTEGALEAMREGSVFVDHTTVSATVTRELSGPAATRGVAFLDAPVS
ncbi:MAG: NAD(P)-dependent oxidoreductase, partial [Actinobacteria bacterium]|nr:NAD(P)-dependent oxidoreductase [Actinomycetota bacterium]NIS31081.1 NAD(P)-dependent oxidoreductase [Actinomycetota bacterium]NIU19148.1 NAD(P)-dependent oxidoreductase [Actinomycetota bacterium]NIU66242.1 NAD(P)-dependent oxidoreductase [Actinomycetota bacterium]NIW28059.1 oxidoreductase [Actinomycetota bacterium]